MNVQDLVRNDVNATAEVSKQAAGLFKNICNKFCNTL